MQNLFEVLQAAAQRAEPVKSYRQHVEEGVKFHTRRATELQEALNIIDTMGGDNLDRLLALVNDKVAEGPHGEGCTCPEHADADGNEKVM